MKENIVFCGVKEAQEPKIRSLVDSFTKRCQPLEETLYVLVDARTMATFCECHVKASNLVKFGTTDVPLDPDEQSEYRANREVVEDHVAYEQMKEDASAHRTFSNIVIEYTEVFDPEHPLKVVGGQHRFNAIKLALERKIDEFHGVKVYFNLDTDQRLDVQLISNTNIAVSSDLLDRALETASGPALRDWCQEVGLLLEKQDFADKRVRGRPITVRAARTFIMNYYEGCKIDPPKFQESRTVPLIVKTGGYDSDWDAFKKENPGTWKDAQLKRAGQEFAQLAQAQHDYFTNQKGKGNIDHAEKALNYAVLSAWSFMAGILSKNSTRLKKHYDLQNRVGIDPLNAAALGKGKHKSDPANYRGLGYRTDAKERGRFVELFYLQTERGDGITPALVDAAIKNYHAKQAMLEAREAQEKALADV